jgi:hypothetical protein
MVSAFALLTGIIATESLEAGFPGPYVILFLAQWFDIVVNVDHSNFFSPLNKIESYNPTLSNIKLQYHAYFPGLRQHFTKKWQG